jgi:transmembrane sensor
MSGVDARTIEAEAATWAMRLDRDRSDPVLLAEIEAWIGDGEPGRRRRGALLQAEAAWVMLGRAACVGADENDISAAQPFVTSPPAGEIRYAPTRWLPRALFGGLTASVAAALVMWPAGAPLGVEYSTTLGEVRRVPLADGSTASINSNADIEVTLRANARVATIRRGEAWFQVAKDKARPFTVEAGRIRVRAVGTAFAVRRYANGAEILVTEGVVEAWASGAEGHRIKLGAGQRAFVANDAAIRELSAGAASVDRALAWRSGRLALAGESLDHAIAELNRNNAVKIELVASAYGSEPLHGMFRTDDPEGFAEAVEQSLGLRAEHEGERILLRER